MDCLVSCQPFWVAQVRPALREPIHSPEWELSLPVPVGVRHLRLELAVTTALPRVAAALYQHQARVFAAQVLPEAVLVSPQGPVLAAVEDSGVP